MAKTQVILSVMASDRPGLTRALARAIQQAGGNWLESHLSRLGGKYVGSVLVELDSASVPALEAEARAVDAQGLAVAVTRADPEVAPAGTGVVVELIGQDRPGIVREVTEVLAGLGVNIDSLSTGTRSGAWSGEQLFVATASLALPAGLDAGAVRDSLEQLSGEIMVDFTVRTAPD